MESGPKSVLAYICGNIFKIGNPSLFSKPGIHLNCSPSGFLQPLNYSEIGDHVITPCLEPQWFYAPRMQMVISHLKSWWFCRTWKPCGIFQTCNPSGFLPLKSQQFVRHEISAVFRTCNLCSLPHLSLPLSSFTSSKQFL